MKVEASRWAAEKALEAALAASDFGADEPVHLFAMESLQGAMMEASAEELREIIQWIVELAPAKFDQVMAKCSE
jgi:hypothetical protein